MRSAILILLFFLGFLFSSTAQENKRAFEQWKKYRLIEFLNMADSTAEKFFVVYNQTQRQIVAIKQDIQRLVSEAMFSIRRHNTEQLKVLNDSLLQKYRYLHTTIENSLQKIRHILNEEQFAKYLMFEMRWNERVQDFILRRKRSPEKKDK